MSLLLLLMMVCSRIEQVKAYPSNCHEASTSLQQNIKEGKGDLLLANNQESRNQRSLYGLDHDIPDIVAPIAVNHLTKEEFLEWLQAPKELAEDNSKGNGNGAMEMAEAEPMPATNGNGGGAENVAASLAAPAPPLGLRSAVSLPAFVPVQLSAMYPASNGNGGNGGNGNGKGNGNGNGNGGGNKNGKPVKLNKIVRFK